MVPLNVVLYWLVIAAVVAGESLLILWAATSTRPRLVRAIVVWVTIVMLMAIGAHVPALLFVMTAVVTWVIVALVPRWPLRLRDSWCITLADLFAVLLVVATVAALWTYARAPWQAVAYLPLLAMPLAPVIAFAHLIVAGPRRGWMAIATVVAMLASAASLVGWDVAQSLGIGYLIRLHHSPGRPLDRLGLHLTLIGLLLVCGIAMAVSARKLWKRPPAGRQRLAYAVVAALAAGMSILIVARFGDEWRLTSAAQLQMELQIAVLAVMPPAALAALVALATWLARRNWSEANLAVRRLVGRAALVAAALVLVPFAWLYWQMVWPRTFSPPPSDPNHYHQIIANLKELMVAVADFEKRRPAAVPGMPNSLPKELVPQLQHVMVLLDAPNAIPAAVLEQESLGMASPHSLNGRQLMTVLSFFDGVEFESEIRGNFDSAADAALGKLRCVEMFCRGGTATNFNLVVHQRSLIVQYHRKVSRPKVLEIIVAIERVIAQRESMETLVARERVYQERRGGWQVRLANALRPFSREDEVPLYFKRHYLKSELDLRSLQFLFAMRLFVQEHNRRPTELAELCPKYLPRPPADPYSQRPFRYSAENRNYLLYSVGPNGIDEGAQGDDIDLSRSAYQYR